MNRVLITSHIILFLLGCAFGLYLKKNEMPTTIWIEKDGEQKAYANLSVEGSKIVTITDTDNPGAYLAFPIYAERGEFPARQTGGM